MFDVSRDLRKQFPEEADYRRERKKWWAKNPIDPGTIHDLVDHIDHIANVAGIDHVGIGSDYDGVETVPRAARRRVVLSVHHAGAAQPRVHEGADSQSPGRECAARDEPRGASDQGELIQLNSATVCPN